MHTITRNRDNCGLFAHPDVVDLVERMNALDEKCPLSIAERNRVIWDIASLENLCGEYFFDLNEAPDPLPDNGKRLLKIRIYPYRNKAPRRFSDFLGYFFRLREWVEKVEEKYEIATRCVRHG